MILIKNIINNEKIYILYNIFRYYNVDFYKNKNKI